MRTWYMSKASMAAVSFCVMMELFAMAAMASFDGARMVMLVAAESVERSCGIEDTRLVRFARDG